MTTDPPVDRATMDEQVERLRQLAARVPDADGSAIAELDRRLLVVWGDAPPEVAVPALLGVLDDTYDDDAMFSVVHLVESAIDGVYLPALVSGYGDLVRRSPEWARVLLRRCLNSEEGAVRLGAVVASMPARGTALIAAAQQMVDDDPPPRHVDAFIAQASTEP